MKFVLGLIAIIFISLAVYVTMGSNGTQQEKKEVTKTVQPKEPVSEDVAVKVTEKQVVHPKVDTSKKLTVNTEALDAVAQASVTTEVEAENDIGKGLTLEGIEAMNLSPEDKERMIADLVVYQTNHMESKPELTFEEGLELISSDVKNGILE